MGIKLFQNITIHYTRSTILIIVANNNIYVMQNILLMKKYIKRIEKSKIMFVIYAIPFVIFSPLTMFLFFIEYIVNGMDINRIFMDKNGGYV